MALTLFIFLACVFLLGFVADPIINMYADPVGTIISTSWGEDEPIHDRRYRERMARAYREEEADGWPEHFFKGLAGMGVLGFAKTMLTFSPFHWIRLGGGGGWGVGGGRAGSTGRDRVANVSFIVLVVGVCTFLFVSINWSSFHVGRAC